MKLLRKLLLKKASREAKRMGKHTQRSAGQISSSSKHLENVGVDIATGNDFTTYAYHDIRNK